MPCPPTAAVPAVGGTTPSGGRGPLPPPPGAHRDIGTDAKAPDGAPSPPSPPEIIVHRDRPPPPPGLPSASFRVEVVPGNGGGEDGLMVRTTHLRETRVAGSSSLRPRAGCPPPEWTWILGAFEQILHPLPRKFPHFGVGGGGLLPPLLRCIGDDAVGHSMVGFGPPPPMEEKGRPPHRELRPPPSAPRFTGGRRAEGKGSAVGKGTAGRSGLEEE